MFSSSTDNLNKAASTTAIVAAVVGTVLGIIFCIGSLVIIICIIKHCNKSRGAVNNGIFLEPYPTYPNNAPYYSPYPNNVPYYPPEYPPSYNSLEAEFNKVPNP